MPNQSINNYSYYNPVKIEPHPAKGSVGLSQFDINLCKRVILVERGLQICQKV